MCYVSMSILGSDLGDNYNDFYCPTLTHTTLQLPLSSLSLLAPTLHVCALFSHLHSPASLLPLVFTLYLYLILTPSLSPSFSHSFLSSPTTPFSIISSAPSRRPNHTPPRIHFLSLTTHLVAPPFPAVSTPFLPSHYHCVPTASQTLFSCHYPPMVFPPPGDSYLPFLHITQV